MEYVLSIYLVGSVVLYTILISGLNPSGELFVKWVITYVVVA